MEVLDLFAYLIKLKNLKFIEIKFIPEALQQDFINYVAGNTITHITEDKKPLIPISLYNMWLDKLKIKGFDYEIDCRKVSLPRIPHLFS